ncbi:bifunctional adenosylcobinamide kinase/adenosylcobinamide-phosphate guanylyltransferase (plasmid) [Cytobacillus spongiae]|uniref:bifunctional adenosylcobinamide kinase/adenosylcobinamide-phosphate guanylyltransferase n=1 Tax=Cytobacillus spongiae TaxID=2901381 RepID=UPI001CD29303|nr:bifunctional adenosylcobinamide kinase/adenosylcobinamide-phosphate guanylyltransferase [Cytobacillus spongiae]MCA1062887.1 bifunctional adenosylcobinamide kinase/adenosylcobinamide-phosphate guanylyltransferase [Rossellomorea aquimaris]UII58493.1 bifunctional adenosylcobinamide kinase/adenosylcobinamide-phosphate guanylyltransferase [Cytobacillus spongiae]
MYFVTGGSFNGKSRWVKTHFNLSKADTTWLSLFEGNIHQLNEWNVSKPFIVIEGLEYGVRSSLLMNEPDFRQSFSMMLDSLSRWEEEHYERKIIWIGSEIGKGIVPMDKFSRGWRDMTGWVYQDLAAMCQQVWAVWYGLATPLKG